MFYIYRITNNVNGKTYIGQRKCPKNKTPMEDSYMGSGKLIKRAIKKHGIENFTKTIICKFFTREMTNFAELYYIKKEMQQKGKDCYNILVGAHWNKDHEPWNKGVHTEGHKHSEETKTNMRRIMIGKNVGKKRTEEFKDSLSKYWKGCKLSDEHKRKIGMANKGSHSNKGQHWKLVDGHRVYYKLEESKIDENVC